MDALDGAEGFAAAMAQPSLPKAINAATEGGDVLRDVLAPPGRRQASLSVVLARETPRVLSLSV